MFLLMAMLTATAPLTDEYAGAQRVLYQQVAKSESGNFVFSPFAVHNAVGLLYSGARGHTAEELTHALDMHGDPNTHAAAQGDLREAILHPPGEIKSTVQLAARLWLDTGAQLHAPYQAQAQRAAGADVAHVELRHHPDAVRHEINTWVAEQTQHLIRDLLPPGSVPNDARLIETTALYFKGSWRQPFSVASQKMPFHGLKRTHEVSMLRTRSAEHWRVSDSNDLVAVEIPYNDGAYALLVVMPKHDFAAVERDFDPHSLAEDTATWQRDSLSLTWPQFHIETAMDVQHVLQALGIHTLFTDEADLSGVSPDKLRVGAFLEKAVISVDQYGTEAAAATATVMRTMALRRENVQVTIDRPFLFYLRDVHTQTVLFSGRVVDL